jgi:hypothetical protein
LTFLRNFLADLVKLRLPVTASAVVATVVALASPFGLDVGPAGPILTAALVVVGTVAAYVQSRSA